MAVGAKSRADIQTAFDNIYPILQGFSKNRVTAPEPAPAPAAPVAQAAAPMQVGSGPFLRKGMFFLSQACLFGLGHVFFKGLHITLIT